VPQLRELTIVPVRAAIASSSTVSVALATVVAAPLSVASVHAAHDRPTIRHWSQSVLTVAAKQRPFGDALVGAKRKTFLIDRFFCATVFSHIIGFCDDFIFSRILFVFCFASQIAFLDFVDLHFTRFGRH
jgi:hypothetical protein